ncbi:MAG: serine/threonine protein kinase [Candidatus Bathyarchaeia archaeon]|jgi:putative serine/threonine protein kinase
MKPPAKMPIENLTEEPYASILCYPHAKPSEVENRILELRGLGVSEVEYSGSGSASNVPVLGKGFVGIVVIAYVKGERLALKMRRLDGGRDDFFHEAEMLKKANSVGVGPRFVAVTKNFLLSQLIDGDLLVNCLEVHKEKTFFRRVLGDVLEQCWRLDLVGLDHGELTKAPRHILMAKTEKPFIVDFETASTQRHASNVTAVCQYLFVGNGVVPRLVAEVLGEKDLNRIIEALRDYKKARSRTCFEAVLKACL